MYNSLTRVQSVFGFFTTVALTLGVFIAATDLYTVRNPSVKSIVPTNVQVVKGRPHYYSSKKEEYAIIKFSLDADLSSVLTWNTKSLFVYVSAQWPDAKNPNMTNEAVIWDNIITNPSADHLLNIGPATLKNLRKRTKGKTIDKSRGMLSLKNQKPKYQITHPSGKIADKDDVTLSLHYNVQPWFGPLSWDMEEDIDFGFWEKLKGGVSEKFALPSIKSKDGKTKA